MKPKGFILYASETGAKLNADVHTGGGDDDTEILQAALDKALEWGHLHLILDGAARVRGLKIHSNTTIECPDADCGLFMSDDIPGPVLRTAHYSLRGGERTQVVHGPGQNAQHLVDIGVRGISGERQAQPADRVRHAQAHGQQDVRRFPG